MSPKSKPIIAPKMFDAALCHYCNKNKLDQRRQTKYENVRKRTDIYLRVFHDGVARK